MPDPSLPEITLSIDSVNIVAKRRKLKATWSFDPTTQLELPLVAGTARWAVARYIEASVDFRAALAESDCYGGADGFSVALAATIRWNSVLGWSKRLHYSPRTVLVRLRDDLLSDPGYLESKVEEANGMAAALRAIRR